MAAAAAATRSLERGGRQVRQDLKDPRDPREPQEPPERQVRRAQRVPSAPPGRWVAHRGLSVRQVLRVQQVRQVLRVLQVHPARQVRQARPARQVPQVPQVPLDRRVRQVRSDLRAGLRLSSSTRSMKGLLRYSSFRPERLSPSPPSDLTQESPQVLATPNSRSQRGVCIASRLSVKRQM